jgi:hypothetical protein
MQKSNSQRKLADSSEQIDVGGDTIPNRDDSGHVPGPAQGSARKSPGS